VGRRENGGKGRGDRRQKELVGGGQEEREREREKLMRRAADGEMRG